MVQAPPRAVTSGPALVRLLARFADADVAGPRPSLSDRLSDWLGWTDAITLSAALNGAPPTVPAHARTAGDDAYAQASAQCERVRAALARAIAAATRAPATPARVAAAPADAPPPDYADFRQRYLSLQQTMESDIGELRQRLRVLLAATTPDAARLATVDAVMERALGERERALFASVPPLLGAHFERLRAAHQPAEDEAPAAPPAPHGAWLRAFAADMQSVLRAELDVRFQPVEGLLAALRTR